MGPIAGGLHLAIQYNFIEHISTPVRMWGSLNRGRELLPHIGSRLADERGWLEGGSDSSAARAQHVL